MSNEETDTEIEAHPRVVQAEESNDDRLTEQIDAGFGPMSVYVSGTDQEEIRETFDHVWDTVLELYEDTIDERREQDSSGNSRTPSSFGD